MNALEPNQLDTFNATLALPKELCGEEQSASVDIRQMSDSLRCKEKSLDCTCYKHRLFHPPSLPQFELKIQPKKNHCKQTAHC